MEVLKALEDAFFYERFWLPTNLSWKDFEVKPGDRIYTARPRDLVSLIPAAICIHLVRIIFERYVAYPFGQYMNISTKTVQATANADLEAVYRLQQYISDDKVQGLSKQLDISERSIHRWFRRRRNQDRPSSMTKFTETSWRCFFYVFIFIYGVFVLWDKPWFTNTRKCWENLPQQHVTGGMYWYYMMELGFYTSLVISWYRDVKRKDAWEQFVHHIATILLMCFSWMLNLVRIGTLIMCLHDSVDYLLEGGKLARYAEKRALCDVLFGLFTLVWFITRIFIYPVFILHTTSVEATEVVGYAHSVFLFNFLLWVLQILHIIWFVIICRVAYTALMSGKVEKDLRSASEESSEEDCKTVNGHSG